MGPPTHHLQADKTIDLLVIQDVMMMELPTPNGTPIYIRFVRAGVSEDDMADQELKDWMLPVIELQRLKVCKRHGNRPCTSSQP